MNRKPIIFALVLLLIVLAIGLRPSERTDDIAMVGQTVPVNFKNYGSGALLDSTTLLHTYAAPDGRFRAAADANGLVRMVIPVADDFRSPEGISQSSTFAAVKEVTDSALRKVPGYGYLLDMPSGWTAVFCVGNGMTDSEPNDNTWVTFICQR
ncbi:hypothetical protein Pla52o_50140 [Novipirellula galeiformis]|uniref:Uncharacterized protein n=1 Tax=Novipirellula galeiformis TaxID=2528004 RepID=A0A5C6C4R2_9BACT|nr:hypothetical protein [Novipirellula galeiformis]TWU17799.1 hypothetical protein Pla52o_50140 [Novipirellula galeiformis]